MLRKRKQPAPNFKILPPYEPITGTRAELMVHGYYPYCAMMQIAAEDTHEKYVLCRGFDVRIEKFIDYNAGDLAASPGIPVAKPYAFRRTGIYKIAQIYAAFLPLQTGNPSPVSVPWRVGQNPGYATVTPGHPADLEETVDFLMTDEGIDINWFMVEAPVTTTLLVELCAQANATRSVPYDCLLGTWDPALDQYCYDNAETVKAIDYRMGPPLAETGFRGMYQPMESDTYGTIYVCVSLDCEVPDEGCVECEEA